MINIMRYLMFLTFFTSPFGFSRSSIIIPPGVYSYTQKGEELIGGQQASITWNIEIKDSYNAILTVSSWHAPFACDGSYIISTGKDYVALSWSAGVNVTTECDLRSPQIFMKKSSAGDVLIRSELFLWGNKDWKKGQ